MKLCFINFLPDVVVLSYHKHWNILTISLLCFFLKRIQKSYMNILYWQYQWYCQHWRHLMSCSMEIRDHFLSPKHRKLNDCEFCHFSMEFKLVFWDANLFTNNNKKNSSQVMIMYILFFLILYYSYTYV